MFSDISLGEVKMRERKRGRLQARDLQNYTAI